MQALVQITGIVQGVGFRPFVYRLAVQHGLVGYVLNRGDAGVEIVVEGAYEVITSFLKGLDQFAPPLATIYDKKVSWHEESGYNKFSIRPSTETRNSFPSIIPPDVGICEDCMKEMTSPKDRRYHYFLLLVLIAAPAIPLLRDCHMIDRPQL